VGSLSLLSLQQHRILLYLLDYYFFRPYKLAQTLRFLGKPGIYPSYSNEVVIILKSSALASTITLLDLMGVTRQLISETYATFTWFGIAAVIYLLLNGVFLWGFNSLYRRFGPAAGD